MEPIAASVLNAEVMHLRKQPLQRRFTYKVKYLLLPLKPAAVAKAPIAWDKFGIWSLRSKDYGSVKTQHPTEFVTQCLQQHEINPDNLYLLTMPRSSGYNFNPISLYLNYHGQALTAVLAEVSNTFGERHYYLCHQQGTPIGKGDEIMAEKVFHVSPFLPREGHYRFRFDIQPQQLGIYIDWLDAKGKKVFITALKGSFTPVTKTQLRRLSWLNPLQSQRVIFLIYWQALKLKMRGLVYRDKPVQKDQKLTTSLPRNTQPATMKPGRNSSANE